MKKVLFTILVSLSALLLAGCAASGSSEAASSAASGSASASGAAAASSAASSGSGQVGMANPWVEAATADEAAADAGLDSFSVADEVGIGDLQFDKPEFSAMENLAQALYESDDVDLTVRKGAALSGVELHGDWTEYPEHWTQDCDGIEVSCYGYAPGLACLIEWSVGDDGYSVAIRGNGGDNIGFSKDRVEALVSEVK